MAIDDRVEAIRQLLERIKTYNRLIVADNFEASTVDDMKGNAKDICDQAKAELDQIKAEIDQWQ